MAIIAPIRSIRKDSIVIITLVKTEQMPGTASQVKVYRFNEIANYFFRMDKIPTNVQKQMIHMKLEY